MNKERTGKTHIASIPDENQKYTDSEDIKRGLRGPCKQSYNRASELI